MVSLQPIFWKAYWVLSGIGIFWATCLVLLINPTLQRHALYAHKFHTGFWHNVSNPEEFGFAKGQVQPFWLDTVDGEKLFCWHVLPLETYVENESELVVATTPGEIVDSLESTVGGKLLTRDSESRIVVNFHGNAGHLAQGWRPSTYRSISGIPHTHLLTCDYRGFGLSSLTNAPHIPTEPGLITDAISLLNYIQTNLNHPPSRTVLLGQSLGTAVTAASALYMADPSNPTLPSTLPKHDSLKLSPEAYASIILIAPFTNLPKLLQTYKIAGIVPILRPLGGYPRIANYLSTKIIDTWPTLHRLHALLQLSASSKKSLHVHILHARNDGDISFRESEAVFEPLQSLMVGEEGAGVVEERRSIQGADRVRRGAFAYKRVEDARGERVVELEVLRYGGHNEVVGWSNVAVAVRRAFSRRTLKPGLDVE